MLAQQAQEAIVFAAKASAEAAATLTARDAASANGALTNTLTLQQAAEVENAMRRA